MEKIIFVLFILSLLTLPAFAEDKNSWTAGDTALQSTFIVLGVIDWKQTREFTGNGHKYPEMYETNPLLGPHPSARKVNVVMGTSIAIHTGIAVLLPQPYRLIWQSLWISVEIHCIHSNYQAGVSIHF